ncbi:Prefoldin alpha subunit (GimC alpha subunit) [Candidatus Methanomethylophilus alvi Mx1201]|jgi:prefoldin alpha subunit|uniref:Prefoldin subunit alpha n=2 Tax=Methanomethylophilus alvi TaxID=1291540 RepID=M9SLZ0_METAX|nr:prefoldin subunit alpha [Methanomethylophilus alvi]AGI86402.1 Prefoldin alpha subunit (GimC alpha subunit) [Candidatus Methanomethylophilus alvi Mx1201]AYQ55765.1 prefoldin subunit alpha [Methanomethylophilus alvi]MCI5973482.1 prefoldin subunit alpha [Methanomethylophilus alvi]MDD7480732.1 prefoldin subunit alpha [Methanomethylophilus alvi]MDY7060345.1 prefoldin subunit alpha [Methanomethylophilus alvi]
MNDEELRQAARTLDSYNQQLENISRQIRLLQASRDETVRASRTLEALADAKEGDEVLIPIGASSFVTVKVTDKKTAVVGIGNKISVDKEYSDAKDFMDRNSAEISDAIQKSVAAMQEIQQYTEDLAAAVQDEYRKRRMQQQGVPSQ